MKEKGNINLFQLFIIIIILTFPLFISRINGSEVNSIQASSSNIADNCFSCHGLKGKEGESKNPGIVAQWENSAHYKAGVGCIDCHQVPSAGSIEDLQNPRYLIETRWDKSSGLKSSSLVMKDGKPVERSDIWKHYGAEIIANVSPRTCATCHPEEAEEFFYSRHSSAAQFVGSLDNFLGRFAEGPAAAVSGCQQCHGSTVRTLPPQEGEDHPRYSADSWPNLGMGRVNADGSWGSCSACHSRHEFSPEMARRPDNCGKCHLGPDHPQLEVYNESKHGIAYQKSVREMKLDKPGGEWILGRDYHQAPTCVTCHMGAVSAHGENKELNLTHDVGARISWTLRPKISYMPPGIKNSQGKVILKEPKKRREEMKQVCSVCHSNRWIDNFYVQFDQAVELYNKKFAKSADLIYSFLIEEKIIDNIPMNEEMDFVFYELWHHEGRRARHGASMMGPDYVQWHGFYDLSRNFYTHFLPLAQELGDKKGKSKKTREFINNTLRGENDQDWEKYHRWIEGLSEEQKLEMFKWEQETYKATH